MFTKKEIDIILFATVRLLNEKKEMRGFYKEDIDEFLLYHESCNCDEYKFFCEVYDRACQEVQDIEEVLEKMLKEFSNAGSL